MCTFFFFIWPQLCMQVCILHWRHLSFTDFVICTVHFINFLFDTGLLKLKLMTTTLTQASKHRNISMHYHSETLPWITLCVPRFAMHTGCVKDWHHSFSLPQLCTNVTYRHALWSLPNAFLQTFGTYGTLAKSAHHRYLLSSVCLHPCFCWTEPIG